jgi:hypothetical protein
LVRKCKRQGAHAPAVDFEGLLHRLAAGQADGGKASCAWDRLQVLVLDQDINGLLVVRGGDSFSRESPYNEIENQVWTGIQLSGFQEAGSSPSWSK